MCHFYFSYNTIKNESVSNLCALWECERTWPRRTVPMESLSCVRTLIGLGFFSFDAFFIWRSQNPSKFSAELFTCNSKEFRCVFSVSAMLSTSRKANALCCASKMVLICTFPLSVWFCVLLSGPSSTQVLQRPADVFQVLCWREITFMGKGQIFKRS